MVACLVGVSAMDRIQVTSAVFSTRLVPTYNRSYSKSRHELGSRSGVRLISLFDFVKVSALYNREYVSSTEGLNIRPQSRHVQSPSITFPTKLESGVKGSYFSVSRKRPSSIDLSTFSGNDESHCDVLKENVGVLLLNLGGPEKLNDVQPFLYNLFSDPDIIRLPWFLRFLQRPLAHFISVMRAPKSKEGYAAIGGGSPLRRLTDEQATALKMSLETKGNPAKVYVGMRYWHPFTEEAVQQIKRDDITRLVVLPLYPQFSISTTGSSIRLLQNIFRADSHLSKLPVSLIQSWYNRDGYIRSMADLIEKELEHLDNTEEVMIFFSAHGVPVSYVRDAGDPYKDQMEECVHLIMDELKRRGINNHHVLAYQSRVGPVEWLKPYTDETLVELGRRGVKGVLAVPVSFVSEHIETLEEMDVEYREVALRSGIERWGRVPALGCTPSFIEDLADAVAEALPSATTATFTTAAVRN